MKRILNAVVVRASIVTVSLSAITGCQTVPETGRSQFNIVSKEQECQLGLTGFEQIKKETPISKDPIGNDILQRVGKRIAAVAPLPDAKWEFVLFESKEVNAFCLPGGKVGIYTGILPFTKDEAGLATVVGHEIAHAVARHGAERMSQAQAINLGSSLFGAAVDGSQYSSIYMLAYGGIAKVGFELPYSRKHEYEADYIGLLYMARAGYNPEEAVAFWQRFADFTKKSGGDSTPSFLRTHPLDDDRIAALKSHIAEAKAQFKPAK